jgi:hypothetical protein
MNKPTDPKGYLSRVKIQVTAENIKRACRIDSRHCMIADAISARIPGVRNISVDMMTIRWSDPSTGWRYIYLTPKPAQYALIDYDMGEPIEPFSFQVRSGHATPMILGTGKQRKRAHKIRGNKILKTSDKGTIVHSAGYDSVPMDYGRDPVPMQCAPITPEEKRSAVGGIGRNPVPPGHKGRPYEWHPSHNSLRKYGLRGFTEGYIKKPKA